MQVDRHVQGLGGLEHRCELRLVEVVAMRMRVDDHGLEAELLALPRSISFTALAGSCGATATMPV